MTTLQNVLVFALILVLLVILHEAGHMIVAKLCGMRVERFSVFFGRPLASFTRGETEYRIGWLPLGGYVKITGMTREELVRREYDPQTGAVTSEVPEPPEVQARAYCNATTPRKVATIVAGPAANVLVGIIAFALAFWVGIATFAQSSTVDTVTAGSPAAAAGLRPGDRVLAINDVAVTNGDPAPLRSEIEKSLGKDITVRVDRGGQPVTLHATPRPDAQNPVLGRLGFAFDPGGRRVGDERFGFAGGLREAVQFTGFLTKEQVKALGKLFVDQKTRSQVSSVVGIGAQYNAVASRGLGTVFQFAGILSLILAIMNLLPFLPLDGGHIVFALAERVRGKPIGIGAFQRASAIGIALVAVLFIYAVNNDITRFTGGGFKP